MEENNNEISYQEQKQMRKEQIQARQEQANANSSVEPKPDSHLALAIIATIFSLIFGIVAIVYSVRVNKLWEKGDVEGAKKASKNALSLSVVGLILGIIGIIRMILSGGI